MTEIRIPVLILKHVEVINENESHHECKSNGMLYDETIRKVVAIGSVSQIACIYS